VVFRILLTNQCSKKNGSEQSSKLLLYTVQNAPMDVNRREKEQMVGVAEDPIPPTYIGQQNIHLCVDYN
ncbi:hypothetical protein UPYG_G00030740, partial [Umbra pygmaea]